MITDFVEYSAFSLIYTVCTYLPLAFFISLVARSSVSSVFYYSLRSTYVYHFIFYLS